MHLLFYLLQNVHFIAPQNIYNISIDPFECFVQTCDIGRLGKFEYKLNATVKISLVVHRLIAIWRSNLIAPKWLRRTLEG